MNKVNKILPETLGQLFFLLGIFLLSENSVKTFIFDKTFIVRSIGFQILLPYYHYAETYFGGVISTICFLILIIAEYAYSLIIVKVGEFTVS